MAFKLSLVADVSSWLRGTKDIEKSLETISDDLDDLEKNAGDGDGAKQFEKRWTDASKDVVDELHKVKKAGGDIGDGVRDGTRKGEEGLHEFKDEAVDTAREAAASFDGSFDSAADAIQETLANALVGFGPAGVAAGLAAAAGVGVVLSMLNDAAEAAHDAQDRVNQLASDLADVGGNTAMLDWASRINDVLQEVIDKKEAWEIWQPEDITRGEQVLALAKDVSLSLDEQATLTRALAGDQDAVAEAMSIIARETAKVKGETRNVVDEYGNVTQVIEGNSSAWDSLGTKISGTSGELQEAVEQQRLAANASKDGAAAMKAQEEAAKDLADSLNSEVSNALNDVSDDMKKVKGGKEVFDFDSWHKDVQAAKRLARRIATGFKSMSGSLTSEQQAEFLKLSPEAQGQILTSWSKGGKKVRKQIQDDLTPTVNLDGTTFTGSPPAVPPVVIPSTIKSPSDAAALVAVGAATAAAAGHPITYQSAVAPPVPPPPPAPNGPITYKTKVTNDGAISGEKSAFHSAQNRADGHKITYKTKLDSSGLAASAYRTAASIHPVIHATVVADKKKP